ncbi:hypothetical protein GH733_002456 [Mirounga leonina]|nr:hypothetical protein GH733_002456 [Mirounga leonina]
MALSFPHDQWKCCCFCPPMFVDDGGDASSRDTQKEGLFQHFCQVVQKEGDQERSSDSVTASISKECREYTAVIGHQWQDLSVVVEMTHLSAKLDLT